MKIDIAGEKSILVELSKEDMSEFNITYDDLDYSNIPTKKILFKIIEQIKLETGKAFDNTEKLQIDVMPDSSGGCLLIFTDCANNMIAIASQSYTFYTSCYDDLVDCARAFSKKITDYPDSSLYKFKDTFILHVSNCNDFQKATLFEFADYCNVDEAEKERLDEYADCIIKKDALKILCGKSF